MAGIESLLVANPFPVTPGPDHHQRVGDNLPETLGASGRWRGKPIIARVQCGCRVWIYVVADRPHPDLVGRLYGNRVSFSLVLLCPGHQSSKIIEQPTSSSSNY